MFQQTAGGNLAYANFLENVLEISPIFIYEQDLIITHQLGEFEEIFTLAAIGFSVGNAAKLA